jgi:hypothetical protein
VERRSERGAGKREESHRITVIILVIRTFEFFGTLLE